MQRYDQYQAGSFVWVRGFACGLLAILSLTACGTKEEAPVAVKPLKREQVPDDPTAKMARAVTVGNSNVPINLKYEILNKPVVGVPVDIELALTPTFGADSMSVAFVGSQGLSVSTENAPSIDVVKAAQVERVKLTVQASEDMVYYLTVTATLYSAGTSSARTFAIPVIVSGPKAAEAAAPAAAAKKS